MLACRLSELQLVRREVEHLLADEAKEIVVQTGSDVLHPVLHLQKTSDSD